MFFQKGKNVLVHCKAGVSRSACLIMSYLIDKFKVNFRGSYDILVKQRPCVGPNRGFQRQLMKYTNDKLKTKQTFADNQPAKERAT